MSSAADLTRRVKRRVGRETRLLRDRLRSRRPATTASPTPGAEGASHNASDALRLYTTHRIEHKAGITGPVRDALIEHHFSKLTGWGADGEERFASDLDRHTFRRHDSTIEYIVPWVDEVASLYHATIVEIGSGTGSSTAAFARFAHVVHGYDISKSATLAAERRLAAHGLSDRATLTVAPPDRLLEVIAEAHSDRRADIVLMFALLEHQTIQERMGTIRTALDIVRPGGVLMIAETPNRLTYVDRHTSLLPFFHLLPVELQLEFASKSPRAGFADNVRFHVDSGADLDKLTELMIRWGQSVSYHEFEMLIPDVHDRIIASGLHPNLMRLRSPQPEEDALRQFVAASGLNIHPGFTRYDLDLVIQM